MSNTVVAFDPKCVLALIERISKLVITSDATPNVSYFCSVDSSIVRLQGAADHDAIPGSDTIPEALSPMLHKISCVLRCNCSGGDMESMAEIEKLLSSYQWDAKMVIVLATFVVDYAQFNAVTRFYKNNSLGKLVAVLKQTPPVSNEMKSKFTSIIEASIKVTRCIAEFSSFPPKHIEKDDEPMAVALKQIPVAARMMIQAVVACASGLNEKLLGGSERWTTGEWTTEEARITKMENFFVEQIKQCQRIIEKKKETIHIEKLKWKFSKKPADDANNQKILKLILKNKDGLLQLATPDTKQEVGVKVLEGKTVLLFISDLEGCSYEISILTMFHEESRKKAGVKCEIVWLPIVETYEFDSSKGKTPWYSLLSPLKPAVVKYVKDEWHHSKKPILVALDPRGKLANPNAFQMLSAWGDAAYPFTQLDISPRLEWSLDLLVGGIHNQPISKWIKEEKVICLFGGKDINKWIDKFSKKVREVKNPAIKIEMMYTGVKITEEVSKVMKERYISWVDGFSDMFWRKIKDMVVNLETHHDVATTILGKVREIQRVGGGEAWALISQGAGKGSGEIAWGEAGVITNALTELETKTDVKHNNFVAALNRCFTGRKTAAPMHFCDKCMHPCFYDHVLN